MIPAFSINLGIVFLQMSSARRPGALIWLRPVGNCLPTGLFSFLQPPALQELIIWNQPVGCPRTGRRAGSRTPSLVCRWVQLSYHDGPWQMIQGCITIATPVDTVTEPKKEHPMVKEPSGQRLLPDLHLESHASPTHFVPLCGKMCENIARGALLLVMSVLKVLTVFSDIFPEPLRIALWRNTHGACRGDGVFRSCDYLRRWHTVEQAPQPDEKHEGRHATNRTKPTR